MGVVICRKHGQQGFDEVCEHIDDEYKKGIYQEHNEFWQSEMYCMLVCDECWRFYDLDRFREMSKMPLDEFLDLDDEKIKPVEDEWREIYDSVNPRLWCVQCVAEIQVKQARRNNESDPFPVYDKTLMANQKRMIGRLKRRLSRKLRFRKPKFKRNFYYYGNTLFISPGACTYPLTIKIYYVISPNEQNKFIKFIEKILKSTKLNQAKIIFYEKENWENIKDENGVTGGVARREKILNEVYLNCEKM